MAISLKDVDYITELYTYHNACTSSHITAKDTTSVFTGSGRLAHVLVEGKAHDGNITVYDNTAGSGTVLFVYISGDAAKNRFTSPNVKFNIGLTIVQASTSDTILYYNPDSV